MLRSILKIAVVTLSIPLLMPLQAESRNKGKLPKEATPLKAAMVKAIFAGKTFTFTPVPTVYYNPDGTLIGFENYNGTESYIDGKWTIDGNEMCEERHIHGSDKTKLNQNSQCKRFYRVGNVIYGQYTEGWPDLLGDVSTGDEKIGKPGDAVTAKVEALRKKFGY